MALDVAAMRGHVTTSLGDDELELLIDAAYADIAKRYGPTGSIVEHRRGQEGPVLMLAHRAASVTAVVEDDTTLAVDDYELRPGGRLLQRKVDGTNPSTYWRGYVEPTYVNAITDAERDRVAIALVKLDSGYQPGVTGERLGDHQITYAANSVFNYEIEREAILASLEPDGVVVF